MTLMTSVAAVANTAFSITTYEFISIFCAVLLVGSLIYSIICEVKFEKRKKRVIKQLEALLDNCSEETKNSEHIT